MDAAAEKAGLERLLGTAGTLGLQQLDDSETASTDSTPDLEEGEPGESANDLVGVCSFDDGWCLFCRH